MGDAGRFRRKANLRPDIVLWSRSRMRVYFIELTVPWEDLVVEAYERKKA